MTTNPLARREGWILAILAGLGLVVLPALNAWVPESSVLHVSTFTLSLYGKYLCYAVLALGVNLLWGYTGLLSLGQCLFFSLGGYCLGMHLMLMIGKLGQYKADIPDFMVFLEFPQRYPATGSKRPPATSPRSFWQATPSIGASMSMSGSRWIYAGGKPDRSSTRACSKPCGGCAISATRSSLSSTTRTPSRLRTTWLTSARVRA